MYAWSADPASNDAVGPRDANRTRNETLFDGFARRLYRRPRRRSYIAEHLDEKFRAALAASRICGIKICDLHRAVVTLEVDRRIHLVMRVVRMRPSADRLSLATDGRCSKSATVCG
jgi:hypothetical protein